jgi:hypothetical protein
LEQFCLIAAAKYLRDCHKYLLSPSIHEKDVLEKHPGLGSYP